MVVLLHVKREIAVHLHVKHDPPPPPPLCHPHQVNNKNHFLPSSSNMSDTNPKRTSKITNGFTKNRLVTTEMAAAARAKFRTVSGRVEMYTSRNKNR